MDKRRFQLVLIKPSHYDDDGYVIRWWRAMIPSNSLAAIYGIAADCAERQVLGPDVAIDIEAIDETNTRIDVPALLARLRAHGNFGLVGAGRRAVEPISARARHRAAVPRRRHCGRHRRLPCLGLPVDARRPRGRSRRLPGHGRLHVRRRGRGPVRRGAARRRRRAARAALQLHERPARPWTARRCRSCRSATSRARSGSAPASTPAAAAPTSARSAPSSTCRAASRATARPTTSSIWCALNWAQGIHKFFITDDNFARNKDWEAIFDRLIELREQRRHPARPDDPGRHAVPQDPEFHREGEARRRHAGLHRPGEHQSGQSRGGEEAPEQDHRIPQDAAGLEGAGHHHARRLYPGLSRRHAGDDPARYRHHPEGTAARHHRVFLPDAAARLGGSSDAVEERRRDGSRPQQIRRRARLHRASEDEHGRNGRRSTARPGRSITRREHMETLLRRAAATGVPMGSLVKVLVTFAIDGSRSKTCIRCRAGIFRLKHPSERRPGLPRERGWVFWPRFAWEALCKHAVSGRHDRAAGAA